MAIILAYAQEIMGEETSIFYDTGGSGLQQEFVEMIGADLEESSISFTMMDGNNCLALAETFIQVPTVNG